MDTCLIRIAKQWAPEWFVNFFVTQEKQNSEQKQDADQMLIKEVRKMVATKPIREIQKPKKLVKKIAKRVKKSS